MPLWDSKANAHNSMLNQDGRVWYTARIRGPNNPDFCKPGSDHPSAQLFPTQRAGRQLSMDDPETEQYTFIDTCFSTHHLQFADDDDNTLWTNGNGQVDAWVNSIAASVRGQLTGQPLPAMIAPRAGLSIVCQGPVSKIYPKTASNLATTPVSINIKLGGWLKPSPSPPSTCSMVSVPSRTVPE